VNIRRKPDGRPFVDVFVDGRRRRVSLLLKGEHAHDVPDAELRRRAAHVAGTPAAPAAVSVELARLSDWYTGTHLPYTGAAPRTIAKAASVLRDFELYCRHRHITRTQQLTFAVIQSFLSWQDEHRPRPAAPKTTHGAVATLRAWLRACVAAGQLSADPVNRWIMPRVPEPEPRALTDDQLAALLDAVRVHDAELYPLVLWVAHTGLRLSDAVALRWQDVSADGFRLRQVKTTRPVEQPLTAPLRDALALAGTRDGVVFRRADGSVWPHRSVLRRLKHAAQAGGFGVAVSVKLLRTTFATRLARAGCHPRLAQRLLGHTRMETTMRYYVDLNTDDARDVLDRLAAPPGHPGA